MEAMLLIFLFFVKPRSPSAHKRASLIAQATPRSTKLLTSLATTSTSAMMLYSKPTMISTSMGLRKTVLPVVPTQAQVPRLAVMPLQAVAKVQVLASPLMLAALKAMPTATYANSQQPTANSTWVAPLPMTSAMTSTSKAA